MANDENLIPPKKGEIRNPKGKPKGTRNRSTIVKQWLEAKTKHLNELTGTEELLEQSDIITLALIKKAQSGDVAAYKELMDSCFGKNVDKTDLTTDGKSLNTTVIQTISEEEAERIKKIKQKLLDNEGQ